MSSRRSVAEALVQFLRELGVRHVFGVSGHSVFDITDAIYREPQIEFVPAQIELAAAYMAASYASEGRSLGVCLGSSGAGATNLVTGVAQAFKESVPLLVLAADVETHLAGRGASSWHEVPQAEIFRPITKFSRTLQHADELLPTLRDAARLALSGRQGPSYVGLPVDLQRQEIALPAPPWSEAPRAPTAPDPALLDRAAELLQGATAPTLVAGNGVYWARAEAQLRELAELLGAPVGTSPSAKGLLSEEHPLALGGLGFGAFPFAHELTLAADVILALGATFSEGMTLGYGHQVIPAGARIIQVDTDPAELGKIYPVTLGIEGDAGLALRGLLARLRADSGVERRTARLERLAAARRDWLATLEQRGRVAEGPINQWQLYHTLRQVVTEETCVVVEGGTSEMAHRFVATSRVHQAGDFRAIGHGLAAAIAIKYAFPDRPVICVSGDGSFMMELQEQATAVRAGLPLVQLVVHNSAYGNMKRDQVLHYGGRVIGTDVYVPDLPQLAASFGAHGERVERPADLLGAVQRALATNRVAVVDVVCPIEGLPVES